MLKKQITFEDPFEGEQVTKTYYFNLTKAEITEWEWSVEGGLRAHLMAIMENPEDNGKEIMEAMKQIILKSYGERVGSDFVKSDEARQRFESSEAYSQLFWELCTQADASAAFINAIVPKDLNENQGQLPLKEAMAEKLGIKTVDQPNLSAVPGTRVITRKEAMEMDADELHSGLVTGRLRIEEPTV